MVTEVTLRNPPDTVLAGDSISFTCVTSASKPQACIRAYIRSSGNVWEVDPDDCNQNSSSVQATTRTLTFTASAEENGAELYCNASNRVTDRPVRSQVYTLNVQYAPVIFCNASHVTVFERQRVKISCDVISNPEGSILWVKDGRPVDDASISNFRGPTRRDVTVATIEFGQADKSLAGTYHIEARNSVGSIRMEVSVTVIDGEYIPREIGIKSCSNNQATLFWASGVDDSLVEYYKLEYRENGEGWKTELVRNPGKFNLVQTTLPDVRSGVFYQFRLQPVSAMFSLEYVTANCTILNSQTCEGLSSTPETGLSKAAMLGVGLVAGIALVSLAVVMVTCWLLRRGRLTYHKELRESDKQTADHDISMQGVAEDIEQPEPPPLGHYEELDTSLRSGTHYEDLSGNVSSSITSDTRLYENATVM
ncbi:uncharacterized protein LOC135462697 [Liolophura sinensis]|uniref:uncharacterized protein LOC135462697 n=1 Tax=Liolophura sinensis TaxID=3198878 RepID=UPI0031585F7D